MASEEYEVTIKGEKFIARPGKAQVMPAKRIIDAQSSDRAQGTAGAQAVIEWFEKCLSREHVKTRKQPGHGDESIEGCQACHMWDCEEDIDHEMTVQDILKEADNLFGKIADRPTG